MKLRRLLKEMTDSLENLDKKSISNNEVFNQAAINLYPVFFPLLVEPRNMDKIRVICTTMAAAVATVNLRKGNDEDFGNMRKTSLCLVKDYKHFRRVSKDLISEYD